jgi:hypothetical protein
MGYGDFRRTNDHPQTAFGRGTERNDEKRNFISRDFHLNYFDYGN